MPSNFSTTSTQRLPSPYRPEADVLSEYAQSLGASLHWAGVVQTATPWVLAVRARPPEFWALEHLLREYPLSSAEGLALMRLAEALLRVPDAQTAMALTADQLARAQFNGSGQSVIAWLSGAAIALGKHILPVAPADAVFSTAAPGLIGRLGARVVLQATIRAVQLLGRQFVLGQTLPQALLAARESRKKQALRYSFDMLGEGARTQADAMRYLQSYSDAIALLGGTAGQGRPLRENDAISIKLSALHPRYEEAQRERVMHELVPRVWHLCALAAAANIALTLDAEESDRLELSLEVFEALLTQVAQHVPHWTGLGIAIQAYQTRSLEQVAHVVALARKYRVHLMCRLVKGAYWDAEIKRAQEMGLPHYPVFTQKHHTDLAYLACARALLQVPERIYPQFGTHNAATIAAVIQMASRAGVEFELQRLHGMGEGVYTEVLQNRGLRCRVYAPVGAHRDLLAYLVRRLLENGANTSFVHQLADPNTDLQQLLASPLIASPLQSPPHAQAQAQLPLHLPLPPAIFGGQPGSRINSSGTDLTVASLREPLLLALQTVHVGEVPHFETSQIADAYARCAASHGAWRSVAVSARAAVLRRAAQTMQARMPELCALLVKEAFKTWADAVSEVREAVDFLRYYADEAERIMQPVACPQVPGTSKGDLLGLTGETNTLHLRSRGVWVCISPWNFPLAVFVGQVAAALVTGNTVLAKPAQQTPAIALLALQIIHAAGVPADALQLLHGPGETVGAALVAQAGISGVVFTGSMQVAKGIQRALAASDGPIIPFIAETGGINAMVVDSSALPEQVVDAVIGSAFRSAGQRCSCLRLLCLHEAIADTVLPMLQGAVAELVMGDPALFCTDVGPVISQAAYENLQHHLTRLRGSAKVLFPHEDTPVRRSESVAWLMAPHGFEVDSIAQVQTEIFGPVLQVVRWNGDPAATIAQINALGYGLTLGIQTRIDSRAQALAHAAQAGNVYINRNMIGAVVGVQPFGGQGLSGTGPKAGGPNYLQRFCVEQTVSINTAAAGGNAALLTANLGGLPLSMEP